jgi:hypothetical protein
LIVSKKVDMEIPAHPRYRGDGSGDLAERRSKKNGKKSENTPRG